VVMVSALGPLAAGAPGGAVHHDAFGRHEGSLPGLRAGVGLRVLYSDERDESWENLFSKRF